MKNYKSKKLNAGFGILEALIASAIIAVFAAGVVVLGNMSLRNVVINKHKLQASYLAQDAVEVIRNIRDSNWVDGEPTTNWDDGIDASKNMIELDKRGSIEKWKMTTSNGPKKIPLNNVDFTREIIITSDINKPKEKNVNIKVSWIDYSKVRTVEINSYITDWMSY